MLSHSAFNTSSQPLNLPEHEYIHTNGYISKAWLARPTGPHLRPWPIDLQTYYLDRQWCPPCILIPFLDSHRVNAEDKQMPTESSFTGLWIVKKVSPYMLHIRASEPGIYLTLIPGPRGDIEIWSAWRQSEPAAAWPSISKPMPRPGKSPEVEARDSYKEWTGI